MTEKLKPQRIRRAKHETDFFVCLRSVPQNVTLSYEAVGMLTYLLSKPDTWDIRIENLIRKDCKETKIRTILKELRTTGHVRLERDIDKKTKRNIEFYYTIHELPLPEGERGVKINEIEITEMNTDTDQKPVDEIPQVENPLNGSATCGSNTPLDNSEKEDSSEEKQNKEKESATQNEIPFSDIPTHRQMCGHIANLFYPQVNHEQITETEWGVIRKSASQLCKAKYLLNDVTGIYKYVDSKFDSFTPLALCKHASAWKAKQPKTLAPPPVEDRYPEDHELASPEQIAEYERLFNEVLLEKSGGKKRESSITT